MTSGVVTPDRAGFAALVDASPVLAVTRRLLADGETPVGVYGKLAGGPGTFLLESAEHGGVWSRYSFIGVRCPAMLTEREGRAVWVGDEPPGITDASDPLEALHQAMGALRSPRRPELPPLSGGLVGYVAYDAVRRLERIGLDTVDDVPVPELAMMLVSDLAVLDHSDGSILLVADVLTAGLAGAPQNAVDAAYDDAVRRLDAMSAALATATPPSVAVVADAADVRPTLCANRTRPDFIAAVERAKEEIRAGEAFQIVVSQRFEVPTAVSPLETYRVLRATNPSPYMYLLRFPDGLDLVGSSPESLVKVEGRRALMHPIAGSRPRGASPEADAALGAELLADPKERSEHVMLVDLGRNDLGRVCRPGSVEVVEFANVERYSHIMHIVSTVVGEVASGQDAFDVLASTFPAGTLTGAPKPRAMQLIEELEPTRRGVYGGVIGYVDAGGDLDTAITIRTALFTGGVVYVQAGAGIVADSDPVAEYEETVHKASAVLQAIARAETLGPAT